MTASLAKASLHLVAGCSVALLVAAASGAAFAHGGDNHNDGDHNGDGGHGRCINCGGGKWSKSDSKSSDNGNHHRRHHHYHHHKITSNKPPLHGPGSSHNPIVYHPPVKTIVGVRKPVFGPAKPGPLPVGNRQGPLPNGTVVHDHRNGKNCSYVVGDLQSECGYAICEDFHGGGYHCHH